MAALGRLLVHPALADGCFVFKWNKGVDINEPNQKAIILYDSGREDLLLQVKYQGSLEEFGWLIPVPGVPTVEEGSMEPFYELSKLTQRYLGASRLGYGGLGGVQGAPDSTVRVLELKTVGAYEVAVLSAQDAGSLARWLQAHDYSLPQEKEEVVQEYIRKAWYFVAAKIQLKNGVGFRLASNPKPQASPGLPAGTNTIQQQLSSGELHPLLIRFDTPRCVYPLKISSLGGKASEVSLYVLSSEPLLQRFIFEKELGKSLEKYRRDLADRERNKERREQSMKTVMRNSRMMSLAWRMYALTPSEKGQRPARDWSLEDLDALSEEIQPFGSPLDDDLYPAGNPSLYCLQVKWGEIPACTKVMPRLNEKTWWLRKVVYTFSPGEMQDLDFEDPIPVLQPLLPNPEGRLAASLIAQNGTRGLAVLLAGCRSTNTTERINASSALRPLNDSRLLEALPALYKDDLPVVRYNAVMATGTNWVPLLADQLMALFHDPRPEIRRQAAQWLSLSESATRAPAYLSLLSDPDPNVQACALHVLLRINPQAIPRASLLVLLSSPQLETVSQALNRLEGGQYPFVAGLPASATGRLPAYQEHLTSAEAAPLTTNRLALVRIMGLKILRANADGPAVDLSLPLLRDTNSLVRNRAFSLLKAVSSQDIPKDEPAKWEQWWAENKNTFQAPKPAQ